MAQTFDNFALTLVEDRWREHDSQTMSELELLVYQSRLVGSDPKLVVWGGGNTSLKGREADFRGRETDVLRVKGSGSDLKAVEAKHFPGVRMDDLLALFEREDMSDAEMVRYVAHCVTEPGVPRPSIETLLHGFVPAASVVHSHADAILALTNNSAHAPLLEDIYGNELVIIPYRRPGFVLSKEVGEAARNHPEANGVILLNHGLVTWHNDPKEAYRLHIEMVNRAVRHLQAAQGASAPNALRGLSARQRRELAAGFAPSLRGLLAPAENGKRIIASFDDSERVVNFVSGATVAPERLPEVLAQGAATPDHILNTKRHALWIDAGDAPTLYQLRDAAQQAYARYREDYEQYYQAHRTNEEMLPVLPRVVLVRGLGMFTTGKNTRAITIASDIYRHTIDIIQAAEATGQYRSLSDQDAFDAEYWPLELYKLSLAPAEQPLARQVVLVTGAAGEIGSSIARRFAAEGAHVVLADLQQDKLDALARDLNRENPQNTALGVTMDVTSESSVRAAFQQAALTYGGIDAIVSNAGFAHNCPVDELKLEDWQRSLDVNTTGHFLVAREALRIMKTQGTGGSLIFIATKNVTAAGKDFGAYSASKAAEAQLARVLALEGGPFGIRSNMINPDAIFGNSQLWSQEVRRQRAASYGIEPEDLEEFYRKRNLLKVRVSAEDVAAAAVFYASEASAKTTGSMLPVDGGVAAAFPR